MFLSSLLQAGVEAARRPARYGRPFDSRIAPAKRCLRAGAQSRLAAEGVGSSCVERLFPMLREAATASVPAPRSRATQRRALIRAAFWMGVRHATTNPTAVGGPPATHAATTRPNASQPPHTPRCSTSTPERLSFRPGWPKFGRIRASFGRLRDKVGRPTDKFGQVQPPARRPAGPPARPPDGAPMLARKPFGSLTSEPGTPNLEHGLPNDPRSGCRSIPGDPPSDLKRASESRPAARCPSASPSRSSQTSASAGCPSASSSA